MAYRFKRREPVVDGVLRIVRAQTASALRALGPSFDDDPVQAVFESRKRCKKVRAAALLVRPVVGSDYATVNRCFRQAGGLLAVYREPHARLETVVKLMTLTENPPQQLSVIRAELERQVEANTRRLLEDDDLVGRVEELLQVGMLRFDRWQIAETDWDVLSPGLADNYREGRGALKLALDEPNPQNLHEFRKYAKYTRNHLRLIEPAAPSLLTPLVTQLRHLGDGLGDAHDLAELSAALDASTEVSFGAETGTTLSQPELEQVTSFIAEHQQRLENNSMTLAVRLYVESPKRFAARLGSYWKLWRTGGSERNPFWPLDVPTT
ncbi:MAG: CHAD domain-containing protein [Acidimicrobiales bacterium]